MQKHDIYYQTNYTKNIIIAKCFDLIEGNKFDGFFYVKQSVCDYFYKEKLKLSQQ